MRTEAPQAVALPNGTHADGEDNAVEANSLRFSFPGSEPVIKDFTLKLPKGSRCLLAGANGSGKTTVLQVLAGQYMVPEDDIRILGRTPFSDLQLSCTGKLTFMGSTWRRNVGSAGFDLPLQGDISAETMIFGVENVDPVRREMLLKLLDIDLSWKMHSVSDGQRRRVQICLGLLKPFQVLLLDEITVDMDVIGRLDLLEFLKQECETRGATIVYATHIFDGIEPWLTHVAYMEDGQLQKSGKIDAVMSQEERGKKLLYVVEEWLRKWRNAKRAEGKKEKSERTQKPIASTPYFPSRHMAFFR
ncbi:hypothetical protein BSKO_12794 [Bryopsis sp. KO-2023]|nr:hypothetical protein BSKO_12794 [Bryopsis sp. KO-2023]